MPSIRPISDLRNSANEISDFCKQTREPVFITRNGTGDMVVQSMAEYERQQALIDLYSKLSVAEAEIADGAEGEVKSKAPRAPRKKFEYNPEKAEERKRDRRDNSDEPHEWVSDSGNATLADLLKGIDFKFDDEENK